MKQVLLALVVIVAVASLAVVGTYAGFSDIEKSEGNYFETGDIEFQLGDTVPWPNVPGTPPDGALFWPDEGYGEDPEGDSVVGTWDRTPGYPGGMQPGDCLESRVYLRNVGSLTEGHLDIECVNSNYDGSGNPTDVLKEAVMVIDYLIYYNGPQVDIVWTDATGQHWNPAYIDDVDGDGRITLHDWELHGVCNLDLPEFNGACLDMRVVFDPPTDPLHPYYRDDKYSGYSTMMTLIFALLQ